MLYSSNTHQAEWEEVISVLLRKMHLHSVILMYSLASWENEQTADEKSHLGKPLR